MHTNMPTHEHTTTCHGFERQNKNISVILTDFVYNPIPFWFIGSWMHPSGEPKVINVCYEVGIQFNKVDPNWT
jgi:hypothetical protein